MNIDELTAELDGILSEVHSNVTTLQEGATITINGEYIPDSQIANDMAKKMIRAANILTIIERM
ncbi:hypothetical protein [Lentilactobacillus kosonis]|uniref:Phage protein n=1 Tax=Lentilactobacillus kosonis TaxID=2810561 RepID=A0A401FJE1_9LACO|nr:hypothetical protein [Lentilactobacillus kosonis]GAY72447.1 hypothetical protein NBRC111893_593 [Lentilactobacillus kosonis]